jgi:hypothetical protein
MNRMSKKYQTIVFLIFCAGILFLINEKLIQFYSGLWMEVKFFAIPTLLFIIVIHRKVISKDKINLFKQMFRFGLFGFVSVVFITSFPYVLMANKYLASPSEFRVKGKILNVKPGRGSGEERLREVTVELENGEIINFSLQHRIFSSVTSGAAIDFRCRVGALGLLFLD